MDERQWGRIAAQVSGAAELSQQFDAHVRGLTLMSGQVDVLLKAFRQICTEKFDAQFKALTAIPAGIDAQLNLLSAIPDGLNAQLKAFTAIPLEIDAQLRALTAVPAGIDAQLKALNAFPTATLDAQLKALTAVPAGIDAQLKALESIPTQKLDARLKALTVNWPFEASFAASSLGRLAVNWPATSFRVEPWSAAAVPGLPAPPAHVDGTRLRVLRVVAALERGGGRLMDAAYSFREGNRVLRESRDPRQASIAVHLIVGSLEETARQVWGTERARLDQVRAEMNIAGELPKEVNSRLTRVYVVRNETPGVAHGAGPTPTEIAEAVIADALYCFEWLLFTYHHSPKSNRRA